MRLRYPVRKLLSIVGAVALLLIAIGAGVHAFFGLTRGTVRSLTGSDQLTFEAEAVGFILTVALYVLVAALPLVFVAVRFVDWRNESALRRRLRPTVDHAIRKASDER